MTEFETNYLAHHGIKGQKWGIRRFQNPDGTLTNYGKQRYAKALSNSDKRLSTEHDEYRKKVNKTGKVSFADRKGIYKEQIKNSKIRKEVYETSKECSEILKKVRKIREKFLDEASSKQDRDKAFNELYDLSHVFKKAANKVYSDLLPDNPDLVALSTDKAGYDDFWNYAYGDWK